MFLDGDADTCSKIPAHVNGVARPGGDEIIIIVSIDLFDIFD